MTRDDRRLSRREREIMDIVYRHGRVTVNDVLAHLEDPPSYSTVRTLLRILEQKGHLHHEQDGPRYAFQPTVPRGTASRSALRHVIETFFEDSTEKAVAALLDMRSSSLSEDELARLQELIDRAREEER